MAPRSRLDEKGRRPREGVHALDRDPRRGEGSRRQDAAYGTVPFLLQGAELRKVGAQLDGDLLGGEKADEVFGDSDIGDLDELGPELPRTCSLLHPLTVSC